MSSPGSLIQLHYHDNLEILKELTDNDGVLYYKGTPIRSSESQPSSGDYITTETMEKYVEQSIAAFVNAAIGDEENNELSVTSDLDTEIQQAITNTLKVLKEE